MSDTSVNDHLEGILSDFEALKRSFDIEDEIPAFSPTPSHGSSFSPSPSSNRANEGRGSTNHTPPAYQSRITVGPSPTQSPVLRNKIVTSLSFNRGTAGGPAVRANGSAGAGISRASSFQSRFNPNGFSSSVSGLGSDSDSLRSSSSSSSLDCQASSSSSKPGPCASSPSAAVAGGLPQGFVGRREFRAPGVVGGAGLKKFSSHGNVFRSEADGSPSAVIHGSMPSLDLQSGIGNRGVAFLGARFGQTGATWSPHRQQGSATTTAPSPRNMTSTPKPKEPGKLNKFPLDLDNLGAKPQVSAVPVETSSPPKPPPRSHPKPASTPASTPAPSVPGSSSGAVDMGLPHTNGEKAGPAMAPGPFRIPAVMGTPVPPAQTPEQPLTSLPQVVPLAPSVPQPTVTASSEPQQGATGAESENVGSTDKEVPLANESAGLAAEERQKADEIQEVLPSNESVGSPDEEVMQANESVDSSEKEVLPPTENVGPTNKEMPRTNEGVGLPNKEFPPANENRIASFSRADDIAPRSKEDIRHGSNHHDNEKKEGPPLQQKSLAKDEGKAHNPQVCV
ncbi:hypothetical protein AGOR_G00221750 [Albula goreensis]|uniref:Uncharacterized protein n=1 Tax=Albula goreensis TaxID=1534307 RepID=A0A8T3CJ55_9TELE|nr:hypothetical protein AGOR_G00221750 [Albula goreensis]